MQRPSPVTKDDSINSFNSGSPALDKWFAAHALPDQESGASRTHVVREVSRVVAFYSLASGGIEHSKAPGGIRRNMPDPVPVMILACLAIARTHQGRGLGRALVRDALLRTLKVAEIAGIRAVMVHALDMQAAAFYQHLGFKPPPVNALIYFARPNAVLAAIDST